MSPYEILDSDDNPQPDNIHVEIHVDLAKSDMEHPQWQLVTQGSENRGLYHSVFFLISDHLFFKVIFDKNHLFFRVIFHHKKR